RARAAPIEIRELETSSSPVDDIGHKRQAHPGTDLLGIEAEPVGDHDDLGAAGAQTLEKRLQARVELDLGDGGSEHGLVLGQQGPLPLEALPAADGARRVQLVDGAPAVGAQSLEEVDAGVRDRDRAVEVQKHRARGQFHPSRPTIPAMSLTSDVLTVERDGHVATLWLDNPDRRNALGPSFWADLPVMMEALSDDEDVRAVVVAARGPAF